MTQPFLDDDYQDRQRTDSENGRCQLCQRLQPLTFHHLIPKKVHRRTRYKKSYSREELNRGIDICRLCHVGLHRLYDEMTLAKGLNTLEKLRGDTAVQKHVRWVRKQKRL